MELDPGLCSCTILAKVERGACDFKQLCGVEGGVGKLIWVGWGLLVSDSALQTLRLLSLMNCCSSVLSKCSLLEPVSEG